jgi:hypothetical protein
MVKTLHVPRWFLITAFALAATVTVLFGARAVVSAIYWSQHRDEPIQPWMTVGMVARSYGVPPDNLFEAVGIMDGRRDRRTLSVIANERQVPVQTLVADLERAIAAARSPPPAGDDPPQTRAPP